MKLKPCFSLTKQSIKKMLQRKLLIKFCFVKMVLRFAKLY